MMAQLALNCARGTLRGDAGVCDDNIGACYCGYGSTYGRVLPPPGSPPGTPPVKLGRPLHDGCKPTTVRALSFSPARVFAHASAVAP